MEILILLLALFVLSLFLGVELITKVPPTLHTRVTDLEPEPEQEPSDESLAVEQ